MNRRERRQAAKVDGIRPGHKALGPKISHAAALPPAGLAEAERHRTAGRMDEARRLYRRTLERAPDEPEALHWLGVLEYKDDNPTAALSLLERAVARTPETAPAAAQRYYHLAEVQRGLDRHGEACVNYRRAVVGMPKMADIHFGLGCSLLALNEMPEAAEAFRQTLALAPEDTEAEDGLAQSLAGLERFEEALAHYDKALTVEPNRPAIHCNKGICLQHLGRFAEAAAAHRRALALDPDFANAHFNLDLLGESLGGAAADGEDRGTTDRLEALLQRPDLAGAARVTAEFTLARQLDKAGEADRAFAHFSRANALKAQSLPTAFDGGALVDYIDRLLATFDAPFFAARRDWGKDDPLPLLVVGMPRSGTTLVEQILASHGQAHGAGELKWFRQLTGSLQERLSSKRSYPHCAAEVTPALAGELAEDYLTDVKRRAPEARRVVDKMPANALRLGLVALLLPGARAIHCRRDPRDTCLSCYFNVFAQGQSFSYDLRHLGLVYRQYERAMAHWAEVLPIPILEVDYEAVIEDTQAQVCRLLDFCGLPWDPRCLDFHETARPVRTASFHQVRQPLYATSVGRWRPYAHHLGPLIEALESADQVQS
jgi:tetratricopeptide (TPR) repeat protein